MSRLDSAPRWRIVARTAAPMALAIALGASASAQATWSPTAPAKDYHCGAVISAPHSPPLTFQSCVIVHGGYVQGAVKITNSTDNPRQVSRPTGYTRVWLDNKPYRNDNCGPTTLAGRQTKFCYGKTTLIPGQHDVFATGYVWTGTGVHDLVHSRHSKTVPAPPPPPSGGRPAFVAPWPCGQARTYYHHSSEVHNALDFNLPGSSDLGTPAVASASGRVVSARSNGGYGNEVVIDHGSGWTSRVAHLLRITVRAGQSVAQRQEVGKVGTTGRSSGPHLHYEQRLRNVAQPIIIGGRALRYSAQPAQIQSDPCR